jgi:dihydroorotase
VDPNAEYVIDVDSFQSKSRNCPFHGRRVKGRVILTAVEGKAAFVYRKP